MKLINSAIAGYKNIFVNTMEPLKDKIRANIINSIEANRQFKANFLYFKTFSRLSGTTIPPFILMFSVLVYLNRK